MRRTRGAAAIAVPESLQDFRNFVFLTWKHLNLPDPTPVQYDIANFLQDIYFRRDPRRSIIEAFRGVGKSCITSTFVLWVLLLNPQAKVLVVSASKDRADAFSVFVKRLIDEVPILAHLRPKEGQRDSALAFDVGPATPDQSPSVKSVGITGQLVGSRADIIVADDVESPNNSATFTQRQQLGERVKEFDAILKPGGIVIYLGTPQTEMSLYSELQTRGYVCRIWPARYPSEPTRRAYGGSLASIIADQLDADPSLEGKPTDPRRFNDVDLIERQASYGRSGFALQFMLDTSLSDALKYPLKCADLMVMGLDTENGPAKCVWAGTEDYWVKDLDSVGFKGDRYHRPMEIITPTREYAGAVMAIDPSGRGTDETGYAVVKMLNGQLYAVASGGFRDGYSPETLMALANIAKKHQVKFIRIEKNFGDGMFTALLQPVLAKVYPCTCEEERSVGQKEARIIDTLEPVMNQHRLVVDDKVIRTDLQVDDPSYQLMYQLTRLTKDRGSLRHDDRVEALSMAVGYWVEAMAQDADRMIADLAQSDLDRQLEDFIDFCVGREQPEAPVDRTWCDTDATAWAGIR